MGEIVVIASGKGGVGKTATTAGLSAALATAGKSVVVLDLDIGLRNLDVALGLDERVVYDLVDVLEQKCRLRQALIRHEEIPNLHLLAASQTRNKEDVDPERLALLCKELRDTYDYILIDSPAGIDRGFQNAIFCADRALVVTIAETAAVRDADKVLEELSKKGLEKSHLILNRARPELVKKGIMLSVGEVLDWLGVELLGIVPEDENVILQSLGRALCITNKKSRAGKAYKNIARRLEGEEVPLLRMRLKKRRLFARGK